jgi:hypothetical protein
MLGSPAMGFFGPFVASAEHTQQTRLGLKREGGVI